jgi:hypothetical protein
VGEVVAAPSPPVGEVRTSASISSAIRTARSAASSQGTGSLKNTMMPSPVNRSRVPSCRWTRRRQRVVLGEDVHDLLGLTGLREGGEAVEVAEHDDDLAPVAREQLLVADDDVGQLWGQEVAEPVGPLELGDVVRHPLLELGVPRHQLGACRSIVSW